MRLTNSPDGYGLVHWALHWLTAGLIFWLLWLGLTMVELPLSPQKFLDYALHKSLGLTVLALILARLAWRRAGAPMRCSRARGRSRGGSGSSPLQCPRPLLCESGA